LAKLRGERLEKRERVEAKAKLDTLRFTVFAEEDGKKTQPTSGVLSRMALSPLVKMEGGVQTKFLYSSIFVKEAGSLRGMSQ